MSTDSPPLCLGCYCPVADSLCARCGWPACGAECAAAPAHAAECAVFANARVRYQPPDDWTASAPQLDCITPLRSAIRNPLTNLTVTANANHFSFNPKP